jgi:hypothetical protein
LLCEVNGDAPRDTCSVGAFMAPPPPRGVCTAGFPGRARTRATRAAICRRPSRTASSWSRRRRHRRTLPCSS